MMKIIVLLLDLTLTMLYMICLDCHEPIFWCYAESTHFFLRFFFFILLTALARAVVGVELLFIV